MGVHEATCSQCGHSFKVKPNALWVLCPACGHSEDEEGADDPTITRPREGQGASPPPLPDEVMAGEDVAPVPAEVLRNEGPTAVDELPDGAPCEEDGVGSGKQLARLALRKVPLGSVRNSGRRRGAAAPTSPPDPFADAERFADGPLIDGDHAETLISTKEGGAPEQIPDVTAVPDGGDHGFGDSRPQHAPPPPPVPPQPPRRAVSPAGGASGQVLPPSVGLDDGEEASFRASEPARATARAAGLPDPRASAAGIPRRATLAGQGAPRPVVLPVPPAEAAPAEAHVPPRVSAVEASSDGLAVFVPEAPILERGGALSAAAPAKRDPADVPELAPLSRRAGAVAPKRSSALRRDAPVKESSTRTILIVVSIAAVAVGGAVLVVMLA